MTVLLLLMRIMGLAVRRLRLRARRRWRLYVERRRQCRAVAQLQRLSDRGLKDIGVARSEIGWLTRHGR